MKHALVSIPFLLTGCSDWFATDVSFGDRAAATVEVGVDLTGPCAGEGSRIDDSGETHWTKTPIGEGPDATCRIDMTWDGDLFSLAKMRADVLDACHPTPDADRCDPDELTLSLAITVDAARFTAGAEVMTREQLVEMSGLARTGDATLFTIDKATPLPLVLGPDPAVRAQLQAAYLAGGALPVHAEGSVELRMADVVRLQESAPEGTLVIELTSELTGSIEVSAR